MIPTISSMRQQLLVVMISRLIAEGHCVRSRVQVRRVGDVVKEWSNGLSYSTRLKVFSAYPF